MKTKKGNFKVGSSGSLKADVVFCSSGEKINACLPQQEKRTSENKCPFNVSDSGTMRSEGVILIAKCRSQEQ